MESNESIDLTQHVNALYGYAMVLSQDAATAADLVQDTYLRAVAAQDRLWENSAVKSWLFTILRNIWLNQLRKSTNEVPLNEEYEQWDGNGASAIPGQSLDPLAVYERETARTMLRAAIEQLPREFREVILLREFEGLSYGTIAATVGCPVGTVMSRLARARSKLRELLCEAGWTEAVRTN